MKQDSWKNQLILGDNKEVMQELLPALAGQINLIYIDPPFNTGKNRATYSDRWNSINDYLSFLRDRLQLMKQLLADTGSIYVHLDWHACHYVKVMMDEIFGYKNFRNEISWRRQIPRGMKAHAEFLPFSADYILIYTKSTGAIWNQPLKTIKLSIDEAEKKYMKDKKGFFRTSDPGTYSFESLVRLNEEGRLYAPYGGRIIIDEKNRKVKASKGNIGVKYYRRKEGNYVIEEIPVDNIWDDIPGLGIISSEWINFDTQKPEALLKRIILASSNPGDIVADFFCGSGTTLAVAEKLGRRWVGCDVSEKAIEVSRNRLEKISAHPFLTIIKTKEKN